MVRLNKIVIAVIIIVVIVMSLPAYAKQKLDLPYRSALSTKHDLRSAPYYELVESDNVKG